MDDVRVCAAGVDACKGGWIAVVLGADGFHRAVVDSRFELLVAALDDVGVIAVDIPIGLPDNEPRAADAAARAFVGPRRSSVFTTPPRVVLQAPDYQAARTLARRQFARGISAQSYALASKILEVEGIALGDSRIVEVHPEVSFRAIADMPLDQAKKTWNGQMARRLLLEGEGIRIPADLGVAGAVAPDDVLDAAAAAWSGRRKAHRSAMSLPDPPEVLSGVAAAIWY